MKARYDKKALEELGRAEKLYADAKNINPLHTKFKGDEKDLKELIISVTNEKFYDMLKGFCLTDPKDIDGLLDLLYGDRYLGGRRFGIDTDTALINAIEKHCN